MSHFLNKLQDNIQGRVLPAEKMANHTTWRIGGPAEVLVVPQNRADVITALQAAAEFHKPVTVIGNGSNLLVADQGIPGLVLKMAGGLDRLEISGETVYAESGCLMPGLVRRTVEHGLAGLEFAAGIPASLGGALSMNAGAHGGAVGGFVQEVQACNYRGEQVVLGARDCKFDYRKSIFQTEEYVVLAATLKLNPGDSGLSRNLIKDYLAKRSSSQPLEYPNAGSVFTNPPGNSAGRLIEQAGGKGKEVGGARVSDKHANFIVNTGNATASDVARLINLVQELVYAKFKIELHPEIKCLGCPRE
ncbi:MAG TPA: UDP-N-acetylmuramate dehydrogenase [Verrucomicrobiae bacterium]|nr:UDP-N-acetylmuramate dehydrogenase [Verrucomicrobiae bacterium]